MTQPLLPLSLQPARLLRRYKRFLADIELADGQQLTIHCANTGAMTHCGSAGDTIWYSTSDNPKRKYPHTWELTENGQQQLICVNTQRPNQLFAKAFAAAQLPEFSAYQQVKREVKYGQNSRIDLLLQQPELPDVYIEIKSCTLLEPPELKQAGVEPSGLEQAEVTQSAIGYFPDSPTIRGQKHLQELSTIAAQGKRAILLFAVMHSGIEQVRPATHIDPIYAQLLIEAVAAGVEVIAYKVQLSTHGLAVLQTVPVTL